MNSHFKAFYCEPSSGNSFSSNSMKKLGIRADFAEQANRHPSSRQLWKFIAIKTAQVITRETSKTSCISLWSQISAENLISAISISLAAGMKSAIEICSKWNFLKEVLLNHSAIAWLWIRFWAWNWIYCKAKIAC